MSNNNFFKEPFDDGTKVKLEIFNRYLREWLPTFIEKKSFIGRIFIFMTFLRE